MTINSSLSREQFLEFRAAYRALANDRQLTARDIMLYNMIRGLPLNRGFTNITNANRLANGANPEYGFKSAKSTLIGSLRYAKTKMVERFQLPEAVLDQLYKEL